MKRALGTSTGLALAALLAIGGCQKAATGANAAANTAVATPVNAEPIATNSPPVEATADADVKAFLGGIYAHYKSSKNNTFQPFEKNAKEVLDADTIALLDADNKALKGEVGVMDGDPLCDCQDFESITAAITVESATPTEAKAGAMLTDTMEKTAAPTKLSFDLVKTPDGWRIHDIGDKDQPSLRKALSDEIAQLKAGK
jgi:phosphate-selective porin